MYIQSFSSIALEIYLVGCTLAFLIFGVFNKFINSDRIVYIGVIAAIFLGATFLINIDAVNTVGFGGSFINDDFSIFIKVVILITVGVVLIASYNSLIASNLMVFEFPILVMCSTIGMMIMVSSQDLLVLFVGLELQALPLYILAAFKKKNLRSSEAGLKFFLLGALSSGLLLYGCSLIYGATGSIAFGEISTSLIGENSWITLMGLGFILSGLAFKLSVVPFHMWAPDVYEGSPTPATLFLATAPKLAALAMTSRLLVLGFPDLSSGWQQILCVLAVCSIFFGSTVAIAQTNIKRLLAYSSISHMGFAIIGLAAGSPEGIASMIWYLIIYLIMTVGIFTFILNTESKDISSLHIDRLSGLSKRSPNLALLMTFLICSMAGLPPFIGFFAKYYIFVAAIESGLVLVVIFAVIGSVIGAFFYLRLVYYMYFVEPSTVAYPSMAKLEYSLILVSGIFVVIGTLNFFGIDEGIQFATQTLFKNG